MTEPTSPPVPPHGAVPPPPATPFPAPGPLAADSGVPAPGYQAPAGAYRVPVGGYQAPAGGYSVPPTTPPASAGLGVFALIAALLAGVVIPVIGGVLGHEIGVRVPAADIAATTGDDLSFLSPARTQVLWAEISFWAGTVLGVAAIALGIVATVKRRGRGQGIAAIVVAALGPLLFFGATFVLFGIGTATGMMAAA
ncbi:hypothetical protein [Microbacterium sp. NPDC058345]|uniref:hypothetical protein n=1 Tax=Microbacterium sp. NPDC058345 TaxID=3346455 RepID=UPI00364E539A